MGDTLIDGQLNSFRVNEEQLDLMRLGLQQQTADKRIETDAFSRTRGSGDKQMEEPA